MYIVEFTTYNEFRHQPQHCNTYSLKENCNMNKTIGPNNFIHYSLYSHPSPNTASLYTKITSLLNTL